MLLEMRGVLMFEEFGLLEVHGHNEVAIDVIGLVNITIRYFRNPSN